MFSFALSYAYRAPAEVYLTLWEQVLTTPVDDVSPMCAAARTACRALRRYAYFHRPGRPRSWLYQGWYEWLDGRPARAGRAWRKSLAYAHKLDMPYEASSIHYSITRFTPAAKVGARTSLAIDRQLFWQHGLRVQQSVGKRKMGRGLRGFTRKKMYKLTVFRVLSILLRLPATAL